jgi:purine-binding chemotaxis protein CheW
MDLILSPPTQLLIFNLADQRFALSLAVVARVVRAVEVTPAPEASPAVWGLINVQGQVMPVVNLRDCLKLPQRAIALSDRFVLVHTATRPLALVVDDIREVITETSGHRYTVEPMIPPTAYVTAITKFENKVIPILNLDPLLAQI